LSILGGRRIGSTCKFPIFSGFLSMRIAAHSSPVTYAGQKSAKTPYFVEKKCLTALPHTRQPVHQRLANELRSIVTPDAGRRPATTNHPGHDPPNIGPRYRAVRMQHQALSSIFVHQG